MTINKILEELAPYQVIIFAILILIPVASYGYGRIASGDKAVDTGHKYVYTVLVYLASVPGILGGVLTAYTLFIERGSLLNVNVVFYYVPIISMAATIIILKSNVDLNEVPGFDRLYGLFLVIAISFTVSLAVIKMRIWLFFGSSMLTLFIIAIALFALFQVGARKMAGPRKKAADKD